jgi:PhnB protein
MKRITPDITLDDCGERLEFYQKVFGGELKNVRKTPEESIMHAELHIRPDCVLYFHDKFSFAGDMVYGSVVLVLEMESEEEINRMYDALKEDGGVRYDLQKTDWGALHAVVEDKHSVVWSLNYMLG